MTLAAQAASNALEGLQDGLRPTALLFASTSPPYVEGGSAQVLAELLRLPASTYVADLAATSRDGLAAIRLATALAAARSGPALVCAAHMRRPSGDGDSGDGAVALLIGDGDGDGLARLVPGPCHAEELRERWRLQGDLDPREGDPSFVHEYGSARVAQLAVDALNDGSVDALNDGDSNPGPVHVALTSARAAARLERTLGGPGDPAFARTGVIGAAHPLLRLLCGLERRGCVVAAAGGLADTLSFEPLVGAEELAAATVAAVAAGTDVDAPHPAPSGDGFEPYASAPRSWRERGADLRLEGVRYGDEAQVHYPPPAAPPTGHEDRAGETVPLTRSGTVLTFTRDHVYPGADLTTMAVLDLDDGARFYCQVVPGEDVAIGDRVRLVPRKLHEGGGIVQYYWKAKPCR